MLQSAASSSDGTRVRHLSLGLLALGGGLLGLRLSIRLALAARGGLALGLALAGLLSRCSCGERVGHTPPPLAIGMRTAPRMQAATSSLSEQLGTQVCVSPVGARKEGMHGVATGCPEHQHPTAASPSLPALAGARIQRHLALTLTPPPSHTCTHACMHTRITRIHPSARAGRARAAHLPGRPPRAPCSQRP